MLSCPEIEGKMDYAEVSETFERLMPQWNKLPEYVRDPIVRDALHKLEDFAHRWWNGHVSTTEAFVTNYITQVNRVRAYTHLTEMAMWDVWGEKLRAMEIG
jgi:hypothetical protein